MRELSLHALDIAENSLRAGATLVELGLDISLERGFITLTVRDNGPGMSRELMEAACDPFFTTGSKPLGLGLPLLKLSAELAGGALRLSGVPGGGLEVTASFALGNVNTMPVGNIAATVAALAQCHPQADFVFTASAPGESFTADTRLLRPILGKELDFSLPRAALWLEGHISENTNHILKRSYVL